MRNILLYILTLVILVGCHNSTNGGSQEDGKIISLRHAQRISIAVHDGYTTVSLANPWKKGSTLHNYILVPADQEMPKQLPSGTIIRTPIKKAVISTSVHCGLAIKLGCKDAIAGVCDPQYIHIPWISNMLEEGKVIDCGSGITPTLEKIIDLNPDAIFLSPFQNNGGYGQVEQLGIPIIETADYMETSALGRAEWMRFYGMLFGVAERSDSLFDTIESEYKRLQSLAKADSTRLSVMMDKQTGSVWYVPGGKSTIGCLIADASANYPWSDNNDSGSLQLSFENVLDKSQDTDIWLFRYNSPSPITYSQLLSEHHGYGQFRPFKEHKAYGCNTATSSFYEDTPFNPPLLLRDIIAITHPSVGLGTPKYFLPVEER